MVCTGNTCRSPLAAALLDQQARGVGLALVVESAGVAAWDGSPASEGAYLTALERGLDLSGHRARRFDRAIGESADLILTMTASHAALIRGMGFAGRTWLLTEWAGVGGAGDVSDPFGGDLEAYRETATELNRLMHGAVERMVMEGW
jgi:protein-tyrosine-phosphatase